MNNSAKNLFVLMVAFSAPVFVHAQTIIIYSTDTYTKVESAQAGDTVLIKPGTYHFRVALTKNNSAASPIIIKAYDPANRPIFDYAGNDSENWPGSDNSSNAQRSVWLITGSYYVIDGVIILNAASAASGNSAGIRYIINANNLTIRNSIIRHCQNGLFGGSGTGTHDVLVENCELDGNGNSQYEHNAYISGGDNFTMRYCYIHDSVGGQNVHMRAMHSYLYYNWIQNAADYEFDMMPADAASSQNMVFVGNVVVTNPTPDNYTKVMTVTSDNGSTSNTYNVTMAWNTFIISEPLNGNQEEIIQLNNGTWASATVVFSNNIVAGHARQVFYRATGTNNVTATGTNNWLYTGSSAGNYGTLTNSIFGTNPGFTNQAQEDFSLTGPTSPQADLSVSPSPTFQYVKHVNGMARATITDVGAYGFGSTPPANNPPTVAKKASANPNPVVGIMKTTLSVLGADDGGESALTYTWAVTGTPPGSVNFSVNGTNGAKSSVATFAALGSYDLQVTIKDGNNLTVTSSLKVTVKKPSSVVVNDPLISGHDQPMINPSEHLEEAFIAFDGSDEAAIYNMSGEQVDTETGTNGAKWNGRDKDGKKLSSGVYPYRLKNSKKKGKLVIVR